MFVKTLHNRKWSLHGCGGQEMDDPKRRIPLVRGGILNPEVTGFISLGTGTTPRMADVDESIAVVGRVLGREPLVIDEQGYEIQIIAGNFDAANHRLAWVESKCKQLEKIVDVEFRLKAKVNGADVVDWMVQTYNPFFGCVVRYLQWHRDRIVFIYREKHRSFVGSFGPGSNRRRCIEDEWLVKDEMIFYRSSRIDVVERATLPDLERLAPISLDEARIQNVIPPGLERRNAVARDGRGKYPPSVSYWCFSETSVLKVLGAFRTVFKVEEAAWLQQIEPGYEYVEGRTADGGIRFRFLRRSDRPKVRGPESELDAVHLELTLNDRSLDAEAVGAELAAAIGSTLYLGRINDLYDGYEYCPLRSFEPNGA